MRKTITSSISVVQYAETRDEIRHLHSGSMVTTNASATYMSDMMETICGEAIFGSYAKNADVELM